MTKSDPYIEFAKVYDTLAERLSIFSIDILIKKISQILFLMIFFNIYSNYRYNLPI